MTALRRWLVTLDTPEGEWTLEVGSVNPDAAGRRAHLSLIAHMHGRDDRYDLDTVHVKAVQETCSHATP